MKITMRKLGFGAKFIKGKKNKATFSPEKEAKATADRDALLLSLNNQTKKDEN